MIVWTIEAALESGVIDEIVVSTNDEAIFEVASQYDVFVDVRPEHLATDETPASAVGAGGVPGPIGCGVTAFDAADAADEAAEIGAAQRGGFAEGDRWEVGAL